MTAYRAALDEQGWCVVEGALSPARLATLRETLVRVAAEEIASGTDYVYEDGSNQRVWVLLNKGRVFEELVRTRSRWANRPSLGELPAVEHQRQHHRPGRQADVPPLHTDYAPRPSRPMRWCQQWFLDDFTDENG
jgi:hypothetical protein